MPTPPPPILSPQRLPFLRKGLVFGSWPLLMSLACTDPTLAEAAPVMPVPTVQPHPSHINVQAIKSKKGIQAWMVEAHEIPVVSLTLAFKNAGNAADPKGLSGLVQLLSGMLDEGAGEWSSQNFKEFLLKKNIELSISASKDTFQISFRTIRENVSEAFRVLKTILSTPRFEDAPLARVKTQMLTILEQSLHNEHTVAAEKLNALIYKDHPYGKSIQESLKEFPTITDIQLRQFMKERFARDQLLITIVGDITPDSAKDYLDKTFGDLPEKAVPLDIKDAPPVTAGATTVEPLNIPQSIIYFTQPGLARSHPDFYAAFILMKIMGDGQLESRLFNEVREKRGLVYGIDANLHWSEHSSLLLGNTATKNTTAQEVITLIRKVWKDMRQGATQAELDFVKKRMIGSFALNFSSTIKIARALLVYQIDNLGIDFINRRNKLISAVTLDDLDRVAKTLLNPEQLTFVIVGQPLGLMTSAPPHDKKPEATPS